MAFDADTYKLLIAADPAAAAAYLAANNPAASTAATPPPPTANAPQAQPQPGAFHTNLASVAPAGPAAARGTLEDFYNQPTGGGGPSVTSKFFNKRQQGSWLQMRVLADVTNADVQHQKTPQGVLQYFKKNGQDDLTRPKLVLVVKVQVLGSSDGTHVVEFPDGQASIWLKGKLGSELLRAMTAAGDPSGYPKAGAELVMVSAGEEPSRTVGFNATKLYTLDYALPAVDLQAVAQAANPMDPTNLASAAPQAAPIPPVPTTPVASAPALTPGPTDVSASSAAPVVTTPPPPPSIGGRSKEELLASLGGSQ